MASRSKKKTTMAKLNRETAVRERRLRKQAKKDARKQVAAGHPGPTGETVTSAVSTAAVPTAAVPGTVEAA